MRTARRVLLCLVLTLVGLVGVAEPLYETSFAKDAWNPEEWILVKSPRFSPLGEWVQEESCIQNKVPEGAEPEELRGARAAETYTSMVWMRKVKGGVVIKTTMEFADRMAPLIVLAPELGEDDKGNPEYREHFEIVLWDQGVNVWHHHFKEGKPSWKLAAYSRFKLEPNTRYELQVEYALKGTDKVLSVSVDGRTFGYMDNSLPDEFHVGLTGCEGVNRFYDFSVTQ